ncbi:Rhodanese-related sulfurtransferase [Salinihabitans flavidus]|uniref:Rhodanese-related sulfurtransferase n=1 Tax=Salinihabitans flavidus TaxID=569882 RepID=A0A1H8QCS7_9RHOB|nr:rhodanese-like domain-containing protein [Salinihabitans flavidus]SEO51704.1 Rhodanese-related sulfurtransferase [Salinihabitans flavidus]
MFFFRQAPTKGMTAQEAVTAQRDGRVTVIDLREHGEVASTGKAAGALHIPLSRLRDMADSRHPDHHPELKPEMALALYCASGARSAQGARLLRQMGFEDVHNIGGLAHWQRAGGTVLNA